MAGKMPRRKKLKQPQNWPIVTISLWLCQMAMTGGEKQRISIARAILKDAPVLLLDEATSSLDPENEVEVQQAIEELVKDRTVVMIAHKLKTIAGADQIIVLDQGEVKEVGTHKELMDNHGLYRHLWDIQQTTAGWQIN